jgi:hypothetical protein
MQDNTCPMHEQEPCSRGFSRGYMIMVSTDYEGRTGSEAHSDVDIRHHWLYGYLIGGRLPHDRCDAGFRCRDGMWMGIGCVHTTDQCGQRGDKMLLVVH